MFNTSVISVCPMLRGFVIYNDNVMSILGALLAPLYNPRFDHSAGVPLLLACPVDIDTRTDGETRERVQELFLQFLLSQILTALDGRFSGLSRSRARSGARARSAAHQVGRSGCRARGERCNSSSFRPPKPRLQLAVVELH